MTTYDPNTKLACTNCGVEAPASQQMGNYIDNGWSLGHRYLGHYGGFSDDFPPEEKQTAHLCHDCCVLMLNALPGLAKFLFPAEYSGHPNANHSKGGISVPSCCEYCWTWDGKCECGQSIVYYGAPAGAWRRVGCFGCEHSETYL